VVCIYLSCDNLSVMHPVWHTIGIRLVYDWHTVVYGELWWYTMAYGGIRWYVGMVYDGIRWYTGHMRVRYTIGKLLV
jgi:hypothetical protein